MHSELGSTIDLYSSSGATANSYSYDPYGQTRSSSGSVVNPFRYAGGYLDGAAGLYKYGARYYDPTEGRFNSQDPSGQELNLFAYASDAPSTLCRPPRHVHAWYFRQPLQERRVPRGLGGRSYRRWSGRSQRYRIGWSGRNARDPSFWGPACW